MLKSIVWTAIAVIIAAVVISLEAKHCDTVYQECQASTPACPFTNPMLIGGKDCSANQKQSQDQTSRACTHANTYLCRVLTPASLPTIYLVLVGIGGIVVAGFTLKSIHHQAVQVKKQTRILKKSARATKRAAIAAKDNIELLINKERARLQVEPDAFAFDTSDQYRPTYEVKYKVTCSGTTPAIILQSCVAAEVSVSQERLHPEQLGPILLPNSFIPSTVERKAPLFGESEHFSDVLDEQIGAGKLFVNFWGYIKYRDIFFKGDGFWVYKFWYVWVPGYYGEDGQFMRYGEPEDNTETKEPPQENPT